jgi:hypothetical protein
VATTEIRDVFGNRIRHSAGALHIIPEPVAPRPQIIPRVAGVLTGAALFGDLANDVWHLRYTVGAMDIVEAGLRLKNGYPDVGLLQPGDGVTVVRATDAITRVDIVCLGDTESSTLSSGECVTLASTEANFRIALVSFAFDPIDDCRSVGMTCSQRQSATQSPATSADQVLVYVRGSSYFGESLT